MTIAIIFTTFFKSHSINTPTKKPLPMVTFIDAMFSIFSKCRSILIIQIVVVFHWIVAKAKTMPKNNLISIEKSDNSIK